MQSVTLSDHSRISATGIWTRKEEVTFEIVLQRLHDPKATHAKWQKIRDEGLRVAFFRERTNVNGKDKARTI